MSPRPESSSRPRSRVKRSARRSDPKRQRPLEVSKRQGTTALFSWLCLGFSPKLPTKSLYSRVVVQGPHGAAAREARTHDRIGTDKGSERVAVLIGGCFVRFKAVYPFPPFFHRYVCVCKLNFARTVDAPGPLQTLPAFLGQSVNDPPHFVELKRRRSICKRQKTNDTVSL
ncbi:hypothetical protein BJ546DRAFT_948802 [Cryomyces antarcticus]